MNLFDLDELLPCLCCYKSDFDKSINLRVHCDIMDPTYDMPFGLIKDATFGFFNE